MKNSLLTDCRDMGKYRREAGVAGVVMLNIIPYSQARNEILDGDALLFRRHPASPSERILAHAGGGVHYHVAMAGWWHRRLLCLEQVPRYGGRNPKLSDRVAECPGRIDVYGLRSKIALRILQNGHNPVSFMLDSLGSPYGWWTIARLSLFHLPIVRWFVPTQTDDWAAPWPLVCSTRMALAYRLAGGDPWPGKSDNMIEPSDFATVPEFFQYRCTLAKG